VAIPDETLGQRERCTLSAVRGQGDHQPGLTPLANPKDVQCSRFNLKCSRLTM
jgi:hypothetical protein